MRKILPFLLSSLVALDLRAQTNNSAPYCGGGFDGSNSLHIDSVGMLGNTFVSMQNQSGLPAFSNRYTFFNNKQLDLLRGTSYSFRIKHAGDTAYFLAVYIDYNIDGDFDDAGERVTQVLRTPSQAIPKDFQTNFTPPATATLGMTRMRVIVFQDSQYAVGNSNAIPCTNFSGGVLNWGECEDYVVRMAARPTLTTLPATDVTLTSAKIRGAVTWNGVTGIPYFYLNNSINTIPPDAGSIYSDTVYASLTGLLPNQVYTFAVGANTDNYSSAGVTLTFVTALTSVRDANGYHGESLYLLYPNPSARKITIQTPAGAFPPLYAEVFDALGKPIGRFSAQGEQIDFHALPTGLYNIAVWTDQGFAFRQKLLLTGE